MVDFTLWGLLSFVLSLPCYRRLIVLGEDQVDLTSLVEFFLLVLGDQGVQDHDT
jgi:hypothetical protein